MTPNSPNRVHPDRSFGSRKTYLSLRKKLTTRPPMKPQTAETR